MGVFRRGLVVGNYCHDVLLQDDVVIAESLGGAASFISNIFSHLNIPCDYVSKVGHDFNYSVFSPPIISPTSKTTLFHAHFSSNTPSNSPDRTLKRVSACDPIHPHDLPQSGRFDFGLAVGVGGEILPETLEKLVEICDVVFVDIQGLIREFDEIDGSVRLVELKRTRFYPLLKRVGFVKASAEEAEFMDVEEVRKMCCVMVTYGEKGCRVYWRDGEVEISPFSTVQIDPTGAGDSLLGGFVAGLAYGLGVPDAALLGNLFGCLTVGEIGLPKFDPKLLQRVKDEVQKRLLQNNENCDCDGDKPEFLFTKTPGHEQFHASLNAVRVASTSVIQECHQNLDNHTDAKAVNHTINHQCNGKKFSHNSVSDEPIGSLKTTPFTHKDKDQPPILECCKFVDDDESKKLL